MGLLGLFGKKRITQSFFVNAYGNDQTRGIYTFNVDMENGEILYKNRFATPSNPVYGFEYGRFVLITYKNRTGAIGDGGVCSYSMTADALMLASRITNDGKTYNCVCTDGDDENCDRVYGTDYYNGEVMMGAVVKRKMVCTLDTFVLHGSSKDPVLQSQPHPTFCTMTPQKDGLIVLDLGQDKVLFFDEDDKGLVLDNVHSLDLTPGSGPIKMLYSEDQTKVYILNSLSSTIDVYDYKDRELKLIQTLNTYPKEEGEEKNQATNMKLSQDFKHLYVLNSGHDSLAFYNVLEDGTLEYVEFVDTSKDPVDLEIFDNKWILVACKKGGIIESYQYLEERKGMLLETKYSYLVNEPVFIEKFGKQI
ncbi:MAG: beta-propeller fold lactonase family protein [Thomasclavelia sp.]|nr:beta-propeller fold lactonase family protein [Thomasclavelia sp.]